MRPRLQDQNDVEDAGQKCATTIKAGPTKQPDSDESVALRRNKGRRLEQVAPGAEDRSR